MNRPDAPTPTPADEDQRDVLDGATDPGHPMAWPANAGQFAARWNAADPDRRDALVHAMQATSDQAERCMVENHIARITSRPSAPTVTTEQMEQAAAAAFLSDDLGGHHKPGPFLLSPHTWENIPEVGRENYRRLVRDVLTALGIEVRDV